MCEFDTGTKVRQWLYYAPKFIFLVMYILIIIHFVQYVYRAHLYDYKIAGILYGVFGKFTLQPINEIEVTSTGNCSAGFELAGLGSWPGTVIGCNCPGVDIVQGACTSNANGCKEINFFLSIDYKTWEGVTFCLKRNQQLSYFANPATCPTGQIRCGPFLCVSEAEPCPLNDVRVISTATPVPSGYTNQSINSNLNLITSSTSGGDPVVDLKISLYDKPCFDPESMPSSRTKKPYVLSRLPESGCGEHGELSHSLNVDDTSITSILTENSISFNNLPGYSSYIEKENAYLIGLQRYGVNYAKPVCQNITSDNVKLMESFEDSLLNAIKGLSITVLVLYQILFVVFLIEVILRLRKNEEEAQILKLISYIGLALFIINAIFVIVEHGMVWDIYVNLRAPKEYYNQLQYNRCFLQDEVDYLILKFYESIGSEYHVLAALGLTILVLGSIGIVIILLMAITDCCVGNERPSISSISFGSERRKIKRRKESNEEGNVEMLIQNNPQN